MFGVYNSFGSWQGVEVDKGCSTEVHIPPFLLSSGTVLERLASVGVSDVLAAIAVGGKSCVVEVSYTEQTNKDTARELILGSKPVNVAGLGYAYPEE